MKQQLLNMALSLVWAGVGAIALVGCFAIMDKLLYTVDIWDEIVKKQNIALGILCAGFVLALGLIIASVVR